MKNRSKWITVANQVKEGDLVSLLGHHSRTSKRGFGKGRKRTTSSIFNPKWSVVRKQFKAVRKYKTKLRLLILHAPALRGALTPELVDELIENLQTKEYEPGQILCSEGDEGDGMYIVMNGSVDILKRISEEEIERRTKEHLGCLEKHDLANLAYQSAKLSADYDKDFLLEKESELKFAENELKRAAKALDELAAKKSSLFADHRLVTSVGKGSLLGETALLTNAPRNATLIASRGSKTMCAFISRSLYKKICEKSGGKMQNKIMKSKFEIMRQGLLNRVKIFRTVTSKVRTKILEVMRPVTYKKGDFICRYGEKAFEFHIIIKGEVDVLLNDDQELSGYRKVSTMRTNDTFGEIGLLFNTERTANVVAVSEEVITMVLHKINFDSLITGELRRRMVSHADAVRMGLKRHTISSTNGIEIEEDEVKSELEKLLLFLQKMQRKLIRLSWRKLRKRVILS